MFLHSPGSREILNKSRRLPFFRAVSSGSRFRLTVTTLIIKWLPPWRIMLTTCLWPTLTTLSWFTYKKEEQFSLFQEAIISQMHLSQNGTDVHNSFPAFCCLKTQLNCTFLCWYDWKYNLFIKNYFCLSHTAKPQLCLAFPAQCILHIYCKVYI